MRYTHHIAWFAISSLSAVLFLCVNLANAYVGSEYISADNLPAGTLIALGGDGKVTRASLIAPTYIGVATDVKDTKVTVAKSGTVEAYVSNIDGSIRTGTRIGLSAYSGVGTAWKEDRQLVGVVAEGVGDTLQWRDVGVQGVSGDSPTQIKIAKVPILLTQNVNNTQSGVSGFAGAIQQTAYVIVGHSVALWRIIAAMVVGFGSLILAFSLLISTGRGSFLSIGRNPLASSTILRGMWRIVFVSAGIMVVGILIAYLILRSGA